MNGAMRGNQGRREKLDQSVGKIAWDKKMCGNVAWALLFHTTLLIFFVTTKMESSGTSIFPYFILVIMVGLFIGIGRHYDKRWRILAPSELSYSSKAYRYRLDLIKLWVLAIGLPFLWAALISTVNPQA